MREAKSDGIESEYLALKPDKNFFRDESNTHKKKIMAQKVQASPKSWIALPIHGRGRVFKRKLNNRAGLIVQRKASISVFQEW